jgi:3-hydroxybenzoate 6-monooxygenase
MLQYLAQGACQAIEDAYCLGTQAAKHSAEGSLDWPAVLRHYVAVSAERTARVQSTARTWGDIWHVDGLARQLRNALFRDRDIDDYKHVDWLYGV